MYQRSKVYVNGIGTGPLMAVKMKTQMQPFALEVSKALIFHKLGRNVRVKTGK